jgi:hypothetical protein
MSCSLRAEEEAETVTLLTQLIQVAAVQAV